jgi:formylglycine-generating enzyme required for sulfatase activity
MAWPPITIGTILGGSSSPARWKVVEDLGCGGFGQVFKVQDISTGTLYAFKLPRKQYQHDIRLLDHFKREAICWTHLNNHSNIVRAYQYYEFPDQGNRPCLSMEYIKGTSLKHIIGEEEYLTPCQVVEYGIGICEGLRSACDIEKRGSVLLHRDISPDNILVSAVDNTPKVTDFGLAKYEDEVSEGGIKGKWPFMAPEVVMSGGWGRREKQIVDRRADIYSLGVTLYLALTKRFPLRLRGTDREVCDLILHQPRIHLRDQLPEDRVGITDQLVEVIMQCVNRSRSERPQTWDVLQNSLIAIKKDVIAASNFLKCTDCGFMSRYARRASCCPVCGGVLIEKTESQAFQKIETETKIPIRKGERLLPRKPTFLNIPAGSCVVGANITFLTSMRRKAASQGISLNALGKPVARQINVPPFEIGQTPVTKGEFVYFQAETGYQDNHELPKQAVRNSSELPIVGITFSDAEAYCEWVGGKLPTADEWEKAARGVDGRPYPWGKKFDPSRCACKESRTSGCVSVSEYQNSPSPFGLLHCVGNVSEFVDGGQGTKKLIRGGCFDDLCEYNGLLWARIRYVDPNIRDERIGFRVAKDIAQYNQLPGFESQFVHFAGKAVIGCDESLIPELECKIPLSGNVLKSFEDNKLRIVQLKPFDICIFPVTNEEYWKFVKATNYKYPSHWHKGLFRWNKRPFLSKYAYHPVTNVTQPDAVAYCNWLTEKYRKKYRLPSREEWEAASRGSEPLVYPWGDIFDVQNCNGAESMWARTVDVREYSNGNSLCGCQQMCGNVFEWLLEERGNSRFMRGGSFASACEVYGMTFFEMETNVSYSSDQVGFRIVRQL